MTPLAWIIIGCICFVVSFTLLLVAWRQRHQDAFYRRFIGDFYAMRKPTPLPACCQSGVDDLSKTTITGSWTCPSCGRFHTFVDGQPGRIDL